MVFADKTEKTLLTDILNKLTQILEKMNIIAERNTTVQVNVEPNITVLPSNVIVNPNITLIGKECRWENMNQEIYISQGMDTYLPPNRTATFVLPNNDVLYEELNISKAKIRLLCKYTEYWVDYTCEILVNGNSVWNGLQNITSIDIDTNLLTAGINNISTNPKTLVYRLYVEMQIKPANC